MVFEWPGLPRLTVLPGRKVAEYQPQQGRDFNRPFGRLSFGSVLHQSIGGEAHSLWEVGQPADNALDEVLTAACAIPGGIFPALNTNHTGPRFGVPPSEERPA